MHWTTRTILGALGGIALAVAAAAPASASDARIDALGVQYEYLEDYILFRQFPTVAARYQNLVTASLGDRNARDRSVGVIGAGKDTGYGVFGLYLNDLGSDAGQTAQVDLTWAKQFSGMALGAAVNWTKSSRETGDAEQSPIYGTENQLSLVGGAKFDVGDASQLEAAAEIAFLTFKNLPGGREDDGKPSYRLSARMMSERSETTTLVPLLQYIHVDRTAKDADEDDTFDTFNLGVAAHHRVNGDDLLIFGIAANYFKQSNELGEVSRWDLPALFVAIEFGVYDWLTARVGATKTLDMETIDSASSDVDTDTLRSRYFFGLGMGLHFEHFDVDATVNPDAVFTGGYLFSGESSQPLGRITGTYYF